MYYLKIIKLCLQVHKMPLPYALGLGRSSFFSEDISHFIQKVSCPLQPLTKSQAN